MENERDVRLRRRIEELVRARVGLLEQDISRLQGEINESFNRLLEQTDVAATMPDQDEAFAQIAADVTAQIDQAGAESVRLGADIALLRDSVVELEEQRTQAEVLNALVARAAHFAPRVVLFVVKGGNAVAWAARGLDEGAKNTSIRGTSISLDTDSVLRAALNSQQTYYGSPEPHEENLGLFNRFGKTRPQRILTVPLKVRSKTAALIYADSAERGEFAINVEAIELLALTAGLIVELVSIRARMSEAAQPAKPTTASAVPPVAQASGESASAPQQAAELVEQSSGSLSAAEPEQRHQVPPDMTYEEPSGELRPPAPAPTFFRSTTESVEPSPQVTTSSAATSTPVGEEEKAHNDARRFARLLVSEIKLYNEQKVADGRRGGDLYDRLKEDIDRSRQMYEKRVTPNVAAKFDYFYDELVSTLAEGDPSKLGSDCPGPSVVATTG
ncbi:MAG TPA: hypothetical protein VKN18_21990 [Blastocatellia bacterium]|nr:hypothetical protein [Blastocatellia bacterium]